MPKKRRFLRRLYTVSEKSEKEEEVIMFSPSLPATICRASSLVGHSLRLFLLSKLFQRRHHVTPKSSKLFFLEILSAALKLHM